MAIGGSSEWVEPGQGTGPSSIVPGVVLMLAGAGIAWAVQSSLDSGEDVGSREMAEAAVPVLAGIAVLGLVLIVLGVIRNQRLNRLREHGQRAAGVITSMKRTMSGGGSADSGGRRVWRYRIRVDAPGGPREVVALNHACANEGQEVLVAYEPDGSDRAVIVGVRPRGTHSPAAMQMEAEGMAEMQRIAEQIQQQMGQYKPPS